MKIEVVLEFKSHGLWAHPGETRVVPDDQGEYFVKNGWAKKVGEDAHPLDISPKVLEVQDGKHAATATSPS